ncbi:hypothetical protein D3C72_1748720 [compost metagenome]
MISSVLTSLNLPSLRQKFEVSVTSGSMTTRNFSFDSAAEDLFLSGIAASGLNPWTT